MASHMLSTYHITSNLCCENTSLTSINIFPMKAQNFLKCRIMSNVFNRFAVNIGLPITVTLDKIDPLLISF